MNRQDELIEFLIYNPWSTELDIHMYLYNGYCKAGCDLVRRYLDKEILIRKQDESTKSVKYLYSINWLHPELLRHEDNPHYDAYKKFIIDLNRYEEEFDAWVALGYNGSDFPETKPIWTGLKIYEYSDSGPKRYKGKTIADSKTVLQRASEIIDNRSEEDIRGYGDIDENMEEAAQIASLMSRKSLTAIDAYHILIALKLVRESNNHREDNILDALAYLAALNDYKDRNEKI